MPRKRNHLWENLQKISEEHGNIRAWEYYPTYVDIIMK